MLSAAFKVTMHRHIKKTAVVALGKINGLQMNEILRLVLFQLESVFCTVCSPVVYNQEILSCEYRTQVTIVFRTNKNKDVSTKINWKRCSCIKIRRDSKCFYVTILFLVVTMKRDNLSLRAQYVII